ncbi:trigger factor [Alphaproteobacteria bacterium]|nr:trigger factor [Alphaproteobacteria bacterium]
MKLEEKKAKGLKREYGATAPWKEIEAAAEKRLASQAKTMKLPGFRPGHVPMDMVRSRYLESAKHEAVEDAVNDAVRQAVEKAAAETADRPKVKMAEGWAYGKDLDVAIEFEVMPDTGAEDFDFSKIKLVRQKAEASEKLVAEALARVAENNKEAENQPASYKAKKGDVAVIDFEGFIDGAAFEGGKGENHALELGSGQFIPGFEDQLVGAKKGDKRDVKTQFPADYHAKALAGKDAVFKVEVKDVAVLKTLEIDDNLAKKLGLKNLAALQEAAAAEMNAEYARLARTETKADLLDRLEEVLTFDIPECLCDQEFAGIWPRVEEARKAGSLDEADKVKSEDELRADYRALAERRVRLGLFLSEVGKKAKIQVSDADLERAVMMEARRFPGQERMVFEYYRSNPRMLDSLRAPIFEDKIVDYIIGKASVEEKKVSPEELQKAAGQPRTVKSSKKSSASAKATADKAKKPATKAASEEAEKPAKPAAKKGK